MTTEQSFQTSCIVSERDQVAALYTHIRPRPSMMAAGIAVLLLAAAVAVLALPSIVRHGGHRSLPFWLVALAVAYVPVYLLFLLPQRVRQLHGQNRVAGEPTEFTITPGSLGVRSSYGVVEVPWDHLHRWREGKRSILVYTNDVFHLVLPKRCFTSDQILLLRSYLAQHVRRVA